MICDFLEEGLFECDEGLVENMKRAALARTFLTPVVHAKVSFSG